MARMPIALNSRCKISSHPRFISYPPVSSFSPRTRPSQWEPSCLFEVAVQLDPLIIGCENIKVGDGVIIPVLGVHQEVLGEDTILLGRGQIGHGNGEEFVNETGH